LLKSLICRLVGPGVTLIDSAAETAAELGRVLQELQLESPPTASATYRFVASDDPLQFLQLGQRFLGDAIEGVEIHAFA
jgi:glutamate racemase